MNFTRPETANQKQMRGSSSSRPALKSQSFLLGLGAFLFQVRTEVNRVCRVDRTTAFLDVLNLSLLVHDESGAVRKLGFIIEDAIGLRHFSLHVTEKGKL